MAKTVTCPQCGTTMVASAPADRRSIVKNMVEGGHSVRYAGNVADSTVEKEESLGVVYTCPRCRYIMRVKDEASNDKKGKAA